jgi:hypothetical protein
MPDLTIEYRQMCSDNDYAQGHVGGYSQVVTNDMQYCSCKGFQFRHSCKHMRIFKDSLCTWHESYSELAQSEEQKKNHICPECGKETVGCKVSV